MALIGYDLNPNGGYRFHKDDGTSMLAFGPEAERLKSWIDQTRPADQRTAAFDASAPFGSAASVPDAGPPKPTPMVSDAGGMSVAPAPAPAASMPPPGLPPALATPHREIQAPRPAPAQPPPPKPAGIQPPANPAELPPMISPPASAPGGGVPVTQGFPSGPAQPSGSGSKPKMVLSEQTLEGIQQTPEEAERARKMLEARQAADDADLAQIRAAAEEKRATLEQQSADAADAALDAHDRQLKAQDQAATVEAAWNKTYAGLQKEQQAAANQKIDPRRLFNGENGTFNTITSALAVGLGAFGASITGGPNYAHQIVQASIDRDINAQADAIHAKRENADNALSNFMRVHGLDVNEAKTAVRAIGQEYAANLAQIRANQIGSIDAKQNAAQLSMKLRADAAKGWADLQAQVKSKEIDKLKLQGGGVAGPAWEWRTGPDGKSYLMDKRTGEIKQSSDETGVYNVGAKPKEAGGQAKLPAKLGGQEATNESAIEDLDNYKKADPGGFVAPDLPGVPRTDARIKLDAIANAIAGKVVVGSNGTISQEELEGIKHDLKSPREQVRQEAADRLKEALGTAHMAIERQRGRVSQGGGGTAEQETP